LAAVLGDAREIKSNSTTASLFQSAFLSRRRYWVEKRRRGSDVDEEFKAGAVEWTIVVGTSGEDEK
jgi:hypothetical protein